MRRFKRVLGLWLPDPRQTSVWTRGHPSKVQCSEPHWKVRSLGTCGNYQCLMVILGVTWWKCSGLSSRLAQHNTNDASSSEFKM